MTCPKLCRAAVTAATILYGPDIGNLFTVMLYVRQKLMMISDFLNIALVTLIHYSEHLRSVAAVTAVLHDLGQFL